MRKNMKMADLIGADYRLLTVIYRLGIKLGFGEKTVEETCRESGVNCDTFLLIANVYSTEGYVPTTEMMTAASAIDLVKYLHASHSYYLDHEIRDMNLLFESLLRPCTQMQRNVIMRFFEGYKEEIERCGGEVVAAIFYGKTVTVPPLFLIKAHVWGEHIVRAIKHRSHVL